MHLETTRRAFRAARLLAPLAAGLLALPAAADDIGWAELIARLGGTGVPTGAGVPVGQVEPLVGSGLYGPDFTNAAEYGDVTFMQQSGAAGLSWHANAVAYSYYGNLSSIAPGITLVYLWEANNFATTGYLKTGSAVSVLPPVAPGGLRIFNNSWIGTFGSASLDNDANRRADFAMNRDDTLFTTGLNNGAGAVPSLLNYQYNGLSVGRMDGDHSWGVVPAGYDGPGRMKPEIVAPGSATSWSTPVVSSVASLLYETAITPPLSGNVNARRNCTIKSVMMCGANHRPGWSNGAPTSGPTRGITAKPLDPVYGADLVNVNNAHWILTAGEQEGQTAVPPVATIGPRGWDLRTVPGNTTFYYRFRITQPVATVSILAASNRIFGTAIGAGSVANFNLTLYRADGTTLMPLTGDGGLPWFSSGNVVSQSAVDNVEHLFVRDLQPGDYVVELKRVDSVTTQVPVCLSWFMPETPQMVGDLNGDLHVNGADLGLLIGNWGGSGVGDINGSGLVDGADLGLLIGGWTG